MAAAVSGAPKINAPWLAGAQCDQCPLRPCIPVASAGPRRASSVRILLVGEAPGATEINTGIPLTGMSGDILNQALADIGLPREQVAVANVCSCRPPQNATPSMEAVRACSGRLAREVSAFDPHVIVALGATALRALTGRQSLARIHGMTVEGSGLYAGRSIVPTWHPAFVLRSPRQYPALKADLAQAWALAKAKVSGPGGGLGSIGCADRIVVELARTPEDVRRLAALIRAEIGEGLLAVDIETDSLSPSKSQLLSVGLAWRHGQEHAAVVLLRGADAQVQSALKQELARILLAHPNLYHNSKFDTAHLRAHGIPARVAADTLLISYVLDERAGAVHGLEYLANTYMAAGDYKSIVEAGKEADPDAAGKVNLSEIDERNLVVYNAMDSFYTLHLFHILDKELDRVDDEIYTAN